MNLETPQPLSEVPEMALKVGNARFIHWIAGAVLALVLVLTAWASIQVARTNGAIEDVKAQTQVFADRLIADKEIIARTIFTDELYARYIKNILCMLWYAGEYSKVKRKPVKKPCRPQKTVNTASCSYSLLFFIWVPNCIFLFFLS